MDAWRRTVALVCSLVMVIVCVGCEDNGDQASSSGDTPAISRVELPPGGLVDSAANFGWTPGELSVSHDGVANYAVPLWSPAGRGSVTPQLSLSYNSGAGNGVLGVGWSLSGLSAITWCGRTMAQDGYTDAGHFDGSDALCLDGKRLVPVVGALCPADRVPHRSGDLRPNRRSTTHKTTCPTTLRLYAKDGTILTFGRDVDARVQPYLLTGTNGAAGPALVRASEPRRATTGWALDRVEDRNGNAAIIDYTRTEGKAAEQWWTELRPARISYLPQPPDQIFVQHGAARPVGQILRRYTHAYRCAHGAIEMWGGPEGEAAEMLRQYQIEYKTNSITRRSLLTSITECDVDEHLQSFPSVPVLPRQL